MKQKIEYNSEELALAAVQGIREKKGLEIVTMDLRKVRGAITDFFVIASGTSDRHVQAVAESGQRLLQRLAQGRGASGAVSRPE